MSRATGLNVHSLSPVSIAAASAFVNRPFPKRRKLIIALGTRPSPSTLER
jgi:hypothetical protein